MMATVKRQPETRPQCPAEGFDTLCCHLRFGHDGNHVHYTSNHGTSIEWEHDQRVWISAEPSIVERDT